MIDRLRIGIIVYEDSEPTDGGGHSYYNTLLEGINNFTFSPGIEVVNIVFYKKTPPVLYLRKPIIYIKGNYDYHKRLTFKNARHGKQAKRTSFFFSGRNPIVKGILDFVKFSHNSRIENILKSNSIDLVYYLKMELFALDYPFIATHWDVAHRSMPAFPETSLHGNYERRERYYQYTLSKAFLILCESEAGKKELLNYYPLFDRKTKVLPIFASKIIQFEAKVDGRLILDKFGISTNKFFFYPAQFWPGKNHYGLIKAFELLLAGNESSELKLVLSGSDKGNLEYILGLIRHLNLQEHVIVTGFITDEELVTMYKNAIALVMPTYLGPTNMPLLEAAHLKCPIVCSDLEGHREMLQEHALYCDPSKPEQLLDAMRKVLNNELRNQLADSCYRHIRNSFFTVEKSVEKLNAILTEIIPIRKTWGTDFYE